MSQPLKRALPMSLPTGRKRGFASVFFLSGFMIISQLVTVSLLQKEREVRMLMQLESILQQERELIPVIRWTNFQLQQERRCSGYRPELGKEVQWKEEEVHLFSDHEEWILKWNKNTGTVTDYEYRRR